MKNGKKKGHLNKESQLGVSLTLYRQRVGRLKHRGLLSAKTEHDARTLSPVAYKALYSARKSYIEIEGKRICLNSLYTNEDGGEVTYSTFRTRLKTYEAKQNSYHFVHDAQIFEWAQTMSQPEWARLIGTGRPRPFRYTGKEYVAERNKVFCSLYHFLLRVDLSEKFDLTRFRLKGGMSIDRALTTEKSDGGQGKGCIYCITCTTSAEKYIGYSYDSRQRFKGHLREALSGSDRLFCKAIRKHGAENFTSRTIQRDLLYRDLPAIEKYFIKTFNTQYPNGLNSTAGGESGGRGGKPITIDGERYPSISAAAMKISESTCQKVPAHVIERRIREGVNKPDALKAPCRRASKHPEAGQPLFRRHKSLLRNSRVDKRWEYYDIFKRDVLEDITLDEVISANLILAKVIDSKPFSKENFKWIPKSQVTVDRCGQECVVNGVNYPSVEAVARFFRVPPSSLRYTIKKRSVSAEGAIKILKA